jgi:hypothetical protein
MEIAAFDFEAALRGLADITPCDSPIEDIFYQDFQKRIPSVARISRQFECRTGSGTFYLDFLVEVGDRRVGFECDGKDFHESIRDSARDRAIIDAGHAHRIYRLRGRDICFHLHDALDLIRVRDRSLFSERGHHNIEALATRASDHRDEFGNPATGFPFAVVRWFERKQDEDECDDDNDHEGFILPTVVYWTDEVTV